MKTQAWKKRNRGELILFLMDVTTHHCHWLEIDCFKVPSLKWWIWTEMELLCKWKILNEVGVRIKARLENLGFRQVDVPHEKIPEGLRWVEEKGSQLV